MCTVSYLPLNEGFILTSNRDERLARSQTVLPKRYKLNGEWLTFPQDQESTGTWIASSGQLTLCLLNGAFEKHVSQPPYRKSRGLVLLDFFLYQTAEKFQSEYDLTGIEPFTLIVVGQQSDQLQLSELRWDGNVSHVKTLSPIEPRLWSSSTLYPGEVRIEREKWFGTWLRGKSTFEQDEILAFHHFAGADDDANGLIMRRENDRQTISITSIQQTKDHQEIVFEDLIHQKVHRTYVY